MAVKRLLVAAAVTLSGCAGLSTGSLTDTANKDDDGFRYYESSPFLLITSDGKGGLNSKILYLPDSTKLRTIKPYSFAAKNDATLTFDKGALVEAKAVIDETIVPASIISALETVATAKVKAMANAPGGSIPSPYLFRIYSDGAGNWSLNGGQALEADGQPVRIRFTQK